MLVKWAMTSEVEGLESTNRILIVALIIAAFFLGSFFNQIASVKNTSPDAKTTKAQTTPNPQAEINMDTIRALFNNKNIVLGNKNSKNLFVEISDPSCPYCSIVAGQNPELNKQVGPRFAMAIDGGTYVPPVPEMKKLVDEKKAAFVYIYYPGHGNGEMGVKALYCANEKGKFWEIHDKLMSADGYNLLNNIIQNDKTKSQQLADFLSDVFDSTAMKACLDSGKYDPKLKEDIALAEALKVSGTPGFYINTTNFGGAYSWTDMQSAVK
jgi:protein-disulfide isomerase